MKSLIEMEKNFEISLKTLVIYGKLEIVKDVFIEPDQLKNSQTYFKFQFRKQKL